MRQGGKDKSDEAMEFEREEARKRRVAQLLDIRNVLATPSGYRLFIRIMDELRIFDTVWSPGAEIHKNAGRQEFGQWLGREIAQAAPGMLGKIVEEMTMREPEPIPKETSNG